MKVLLAIDSSEASQYVIAEAKSRPWPSATVVCVQSVVDVWNCGGVAPLIQDAEHEAKKLVTAARYELSRSGQEVFSEVQAGLPKKAIPEYAKEWGADLIMVGSHGLRALPRFLLGSVAQAVLRAAPCSVEIVRPSPRRVPAYSHGMRILLATDGSVCSERAARAVANRPWPAESQVRILSVVEFPVVLTTPSPAYSEYPDTMLEAVYNEARSRAEDAVARARSTLSTAGLKIWEGRVTPDGDPRPTILDVAKEWEADLIVLGSHGRRGFDRVLLGSVSESVSMHAHCSVEVVREQPPDQAEDDRILDSIELRQ